MSTKFYAMILMLLISVTGFSQTTNSYTYACPLKFAPTVYGGVKTYYGVGAVVANQTGVSCPINQSATGCITNGTTTVSNPPLTQAYIGSISGSSSPAFICNYNSQAVVLIPNIKYPTNCKKVSSGSIQCTGS